MSDDDLDLSNIDDTPAPVEPSAEERQIAVENIDAATAYSPETQEALSLLAMAVDALGGVLVIPAAQLHRRFALGIDHAHYRNTGDMRIYVVRQDG